MTRAMVAPIGGRLTGKNGDGDHVRPATSVRRGSHCVVDSCAKRGSSIGFIGLQYLLCDGASTDDTVGVATALQRT